MQQVEGPGERTPNCPPNAAGRRSHPAFPAGGIRRMIKVTIEVRGQGERTTTHELEIINDGTGTEEIGNYDFILVDKRQHSLVLVCDRIEGWNRRNPAWRLVREALDKC
jgi:hypothetical protein